MEIQSAVETSRLYHDFNSLSKLRGVVEDGAAIKEAAKQFETMFYSMMLKSMRDASKAISPEPMFDSPSMDLFQDMYDKQLSLEFGTSEQGALGLADILVQQLTGNTSVADSKINKEIPNLNIPSLPQVSTKANISARPNEAANIETTAVKLSDDVVTNKLTEASNTDNMGKEISDKGLDYSSPTAFVSSLLPYAQKFADKLKMDPRVLLAQAALETGWGKYVMRTADGMSSNNLFGIKADKNWQGNQATVQTLEFESGQLRQKVASFKAYSDPDQAFTDYVSLIKSKPRYQDALNATSSPTDYLQKLQQAGYATDPDYAQKIINIFRSDTLNDAVVAADQPMRLEP